MKMGSVIWFCQINEKTIVFYRKFRNFKRMAEVPAMLWFANKRVLRFLHFQVTRPTEKTELFTLHFSMCMKMEMFVWERWM